MGELWESRVQSAASQRAALSLSDPTAPPSQPRPRHPCPNPAVFYLCFSFGRESQEAPRRSHAAPSNDVGTQARLCAALRALRGQQSAPRTAVRASVLTST